MSQVSRRFLEPKVYFSVLKSLAGVITSLKNEKDVGIFIDDFFSRTEKIMLAKRLAIALMLKKGFSYQEIESILKVSTSTVCKVNFIMENGEGYKIAIERMVQREELKKFWKEIAHMIGKGYKVFG